MRIRWVVLCVLDCVISDVSSVMCTRRLFAQSAQNLLLYELDEKNSSRQLLIRHVYELSSNHKSLLRSEQHTLLPCDLVQGSTLSILKRYIIHFGRNVSYKNKLIGLNTNYFILIVSSVTVEDISTGFMVNVCVLEVKKKSLNQKLSLIWSSPCGNKTQLCVLRCRGVHNVQLLNGPSACYLQNNHLCFASRWVIYHVCVCE